MYLVSALSLVKHILLYRLVCMQKTTPNVINWQDYEGCTALHLAVADGNEAVVAALVNVQFLLVFKF